MLAAFIIGISATACVDGQGAGSIPLSARVPTAGAASPSAREPPPTAILASTATTTLPDILIDSRRRIKGDRTFSIALGDLDRDGDLDVLVANYLSTGSVWWNDGTGRFERGQNIGTATGHGIALGDLDNDGDLDALIVHNGDADQVWLNDGVGGLTDSGQRLGTSEDATTTVALGDIDGDGDLDAFTTHHQRPVELWLNNGEGMLSARDGGTGSDALSVALGDVDGDGDLDALVSFVESPDRVWLNDGRGNLADSGQTLSGEAGWGRAALGDIDGDGDLDAFISNSVNGNAVWFNAGGAQGGTPGVFVKVGQALGEGSFAVLGDLDRDGDLDALTCQGQWLNDGEGAFHDVGTRFAVPACGGIWLGDVDGDGDLDAFVASRQGDNELWLNESP